MSAAYWSGEMVRRLSHARIAHRERVKALNRVAEGESILTPEQRRSLTHSEKMVRELIDELSDGARGRARVVSLEEVAALREALPKALLEQYELLFCRAYGSDPAVSVGDSAVIRGIGKREARTNSGSVQQPVPGAPSATKKFGQAQRNVVQDRRAYDMKIKVDRRLRRIAHEIADELNGDVRVFEVNVCTHCARIGDDDWGFCPKCGARMNKEER